MLNIVLFCFIFGFELTLSQQTHAASTIIDEIGRLEGHKDPKCYATANRLEDFMYGTPLAFEARLEKIARQKALVLDIWQQASSAARHAGKLEVTADVIEPLVQRALPHVKTPADDWSVTTPNGERLVISHRDQRHYASIAYGLRAILAVQQDDMLTPDAVLLPLDNASIGLLKQLLDIYTLAVLQTADRQARLQNQRQISAALFKDMWLALAATPQEPPAPRVTAPQPAPEPATRFRTIKAIIEQKLASYQVYNRIATPVFLRNLQVFFARRRWPSDPQQGRAFKNYFTQAMTFFVTDTLLGAEKIARDAGRAVIGVDDVHTALQAFTPHVIDAYEDVTFFPRLPAQERIVIESYDLDAFRDSGIHWTYLKYALENPQYRGVLEPDPFAAELLVEGAAQFGVLALRLAGIEAKQEDSARLHTDHLDKALRRIQALLNQHAQHPPQTEDGEPLASSEEVPSPAGATPFFSDVTEQVNLQFMHRSADWLSRMLRSYVMKGPDVAQLNIPPAFGGSGVAAEDIDNDGYPDLLLLSGAGNQLWLNNRQGGFVDITAEAGLDWRRPEDGQPGEPRQPIIADFDNDGLQDILITYVDDQHRLYRNLGEHRFADVTERAGLGGKGSVGGPATAFDFDRDGLLDLYIGYFGDYLHGIQPTLARRNTNGLPNKLFRNTGKMQFADVTAGSGVDNSGWTQAVGHTDFDLDGWQDLIVGNDFGVNAYYRNRGDGSFVNVAGLLGTDKPSYTMNIGITDLNRDGYPDFYISNIVTMNKDEKYILPNAETPMKFNPEKLAQMRVVEANDLFTSRVTDGVFERYALSNAVARGVSSTGWSWDADFFDFDNDGDDDLYCVNGMNEYSVYSSDNPYYADPLGVARNVVIPVAEKESNVFFVNTGGMLHNESAQSGANLLGNSRSVAYLDFDRDGDLDMVVNNYHGRAVFYRNNAEARGHHWIKIRLRGDPAKGSSRDAIGARLIVSSANHKQQWREVHSTIGYLSGHPKQQHVGLGADTHATVTVHWPNGDVAQFANLKADATYTIAQGQGLRRNATTATAQ